MTLEKLNGHRDLVLKLHKAMEMVSRLREKAEPHSPSLTGMPHGSGIGDKVADLAIEIADLEARCGYLNAAIAEDKEVEEWIAAIPDDMIRLIFRLRFIRGMEWKVVADFVGGYNTEDSVRSIAYRYLKTCPTVTTDDAT